MQQFAVKISIEKLLRIRFDKMDFLQFSGPDQSMNFTSI